MSEFSNKARSDNKLSQNTDSTHRFYICCSYWEYIHSHTFGRNNAKFPWNENGSVTVWKMKRPFSFKKIISMFS